jgi:DNA modification methylase
VAAKKIGLPFIGIEINTDYINIINERLLRAVVETAEATINN